MRFALTFLFCLCGTVACSSSGASAPDAPLDLDATSPPDLLLPDLLTLPVGTACGPASAPCEDGLLCCEPCCQGQEATCRTPERNDAGIGVGQCALPDLELDEGALAAEIGVGVEDFVAGSCELQERCVGAPGRRRLLHFSVVTPNVGTADLAFGDPLSNPLFQYSLCHQHYHFKGYAAYRLLDLSGRVLVVGRKQAFCLLDFERQANPPLGGRTQPRYDCSMQGISKGWQDIYYNGLPCQFLDVTDVPPGKYLLEVEINPEHLIPELRYDNNVGRALVVISPGIPSITSPCQGVVSGLDRECGWHSGGTLPCTPGAQIHVACDGYCALQDRLGSCVGDTLIRICPGDTPCARSEATGENDDACDVSVSTCSSVYFLCPSSGKYTILWGSYSSDQPATCNLGHVP